MDQTASDADAAWTLDPAPATASERRRRSHSDCMLYRQASNDGPDGQPAHWLLEPRFEGAVVRYITTSW